MKQEVNFSSSEIRSLRPFLGEMKERFTQNPVDIEVVAVSQLAHMHKLKGDSLLEGIYTPAELKYARHNQRDMYNKLGGKLAAKRAIRRFLGTQVPYTDIEVTQRERGYPPRIELHGIAAVMAETDGTVYPISISHDAGMAIAIAATQTSETGRIRVGADVTQVERLRSDLEIRNPRVLKRIFNEMEFEETQDPIKLAEKFAVKEAVSKALGMGLKNGIHLPDIIVLNDNGNTVLTLEAGSRERAEALSITSWNIVTGNQNDAAFAFVAAR